MLSNWRSRPRPTKKLAEKDRLYNRASGKSAEGETVADGIVIAVKRVNSRGAKDPY